MVGVEVAENERVGVVEEIENWIGVEAVAGRTRGSRRDVTVDDVETAVVDFDVDAENFEKRVDVGER